MRYLGIDYGEKRIGIALSDTGSRIAFPKKTIFNQATRTVEQIMALIKEESVSKIIVGLPLSADGKDTEITRRVRDFVGSLKKFTVLPIEFENELLTTRIVKQHGIEKEKVDQSSAALILQSYLDKQNHK